MACNLTKSPSWGHGTTCTSPVNGTFTINSFVFLDLETSHLHSLDRPTIIEMSLIAVHRTGLVHPDVISSLERARRCDGVTDLAKLTLPRVVDKMTLCLDPRKHTSPATFLLTKLDNLNLGESKKMPFDDGVVSMLKLFLQRQEAPVCLVAHNGMNFDFRLLRTELARLGAEKRFEGVFCIDSLEAFRAGFVNADRNMEGSGDVSFARPPPLKRKAAVGGTELGDPTPVKKGANCSDVDQARMECLVSDADKSSHIPVSNIENNEDAPPQVANPHGFTKDTKASISMRTQVTSCVNRAQSSNQTDRASRSARDANMLTAPDVSSIGSASSGNQLNSVSSNNVVQMQTNGSSSVGLEGGVELSSSPSPSCIPELSDSLPRRSPPPPPMKSRDPNRYAYVHANDIAPKISYSLINVFKRTFGREPPVSHAAEDDITSLVKILLPRVREFVQWADKNVTEFNSIDFYYRPRKPKRKLVF